MHVHEKSFGSALAFVVARANPDGIYVTPVGLTLWVLFWVPVNFAGRREQNPGVDFQGPLGQPHCAQHRDFPCSHRIGLVKGRRRRTGQMIDEVGVGKLSARQNVSLDKRDALALEQRSVDLAT